MEEYGSFKKYNDYELLYLMKLGDDDAKDVFYWKYSYFIYSKLSDYKMNHNHWDDYFQEGMFSLIKALKIYDPEEGMCFTNFFGKILERKFIDIKRLENKDKNLDLFEDIDEIELPKPEEKHLPIDMDPDLYDFSPLEKQVFILMYLEGKKRGEVAEILQIEPKNISNAQQRIITKVKKEIERKNNR